MLSPESSLSERLRPCGNNNSMILGTEIFGISDARAPDAPKEIIINTTIDRTTRAALIVVSPFSAPFHAIRAPKLDSKRSTSLSATNAPLGGIGGVVSAAFMAARAPSEGRRSTAEGGREGLFLFAIRSTPF